MSFRGPVSGPMVGRSCPEAMVWSLPETQTPPLLIAFGTPFSQAVPVEEGREHPLPRHLLGPGISTSTRYNKAQCTKAIEKYKQILHNPDWRHYTVLFVSAYEGDRTYIESEVEKLHVAGAKPQVKVVDAVSGLQADVVICTTTCSRKHSNGRPSGWKFWYGIPWWAGIL